MYYGNPNKAVGMYSRLSTLDGAENAFRAEFLKVDRIATDIGNVKRRVEALGVSWETTKLRALLNGARFYRDEDTILETGRAHPWDEFNDYLRHENGDMDLRPKYAA